MKRDKLDAVFSLCIRESYEWTCVKCHKSYEKGSMGLHCSHLFGRSHKSVRCYSRNAVAHCFYCHLWFAANPLESGSWARHFLGETGYEQLMLKKNTTVRWNKILKDELYHHWKAELARIKKLRDQGVTGIIRLVDYD